MKIKFFISSLGNGGAERVVCVLANSLVRAGHDVSIMLLADDHIYFPICDQVKISFLDREWKKKKNKTFRIIQRIRLIRKTVETDKPDVVISFISETNIDVSIALAFHKVPLIVSERSDPKINPPSRMKRVLRRFIYFRPDGYVFQTPNAQMYFNKSIQKKSAVILNPLASDLPECYTGARDKRIVTVVRLSKIKNIPLLLEAFKQFVRIKPEYLLEIYGEGDQEDEIRTIIEEEHLSGNVRLMGFCKDVHERINRAAMFVMSSDYEGLPNALMEAMAQGLPCISTDCPCGGPRTLIDHGSNGLLVKVGDAEGLLKAMVDILDNPIYKGIGEKAQNIRTIASTQVITKKWMDYIIEVINRGQHDRKRT